MLVLSLCMKKKMRVPAMGHRFQNLYILRDCLPFIMIATCRVSIHKLGTLDQVRAYTNFDKIHKKALEQVRVVASLLTSGYTD